MKGKKDRASLEVREAGIFCPVGRVGLWVILMDDVGLKLPVNLLSCWSGIVRLCLHVYDLICIVLSVHLQFFSHSVITLCLSCRKSLILGFIFFKVCG